MLSKFERRILRIIYGPVNVKVMCRRGYISELCTLYSELDTVKVVKIGRVRWLGHVLRIPELDPCGQLTVRNPLKTKCRLIHLKTQFVPRCKHF